MARTALDKLNAEGLWHGPNAFLSKKLKHAYQIQNSKSFQGAFEADAFENYKKFQSANNTLYLGKPGPLFMPQIGRDKIRNSEGSLKVLETQEELDALFVSKKKETPPEKTVDVAEPEPEYDVPDEVTNITKLQSYDLDYTLQNGIVHVESFRQYSIMVFGADPIGVEVSAALAKMGVDNLTLLDSDRVTQKDVAIGCNRKFDAYRRRTVAAQEIIFDGSNCEAKVVKKATAELLENVDIVINTFSSSQIRKDFWALLKRNPNVMLYVDVQVADNHGTIYVIDPEDEESIKLYESTLDNETKTLDKVVWMVKLFAALVVGIVQRYALATHENAAKSVLDRMYVVDMDSFYQFAGASHKIKSV